VGVGEMVETCGIFITGTEAANVTFVATDAVWQELGMEQSKCIL